MYTFFKTVCKHVGTSATNLLNTTLWIVRIGLRFLRRERKSLLDVVIYPNVTVYLFEGSTLKRQSVIWQLAVYWQ